MAFFHFGELPGVGMRSLEMAARLIMKIATPKSTKDRAKLNRSPLQASRAGMSPAPTMDVHMTVSDTDRSPVALGQTMARTEKPTGKKQTTNMG